MTMFYTDPIKRNVWSTRIIRVQSPEDASLLHARHKVETVLRTYHKLLALGVEPEMTIFAVGEEFGLTKEYTQRASNNARTLLGRIGIPTPEDELSSPCHSRDLIPISRAELMQMINSIDINYDNRRKTKCDHRAASGTDATSLCDGDRTDPTPQIQ